MTVRMYGLRSNLGLMNTLHGAAVGLLSVPDSGTSVKPTMASSLSKAVRQMAWQGGLRSSAGRAMTEVLGSFMKGGPTSGCHHMLQSASTRSLSSESSKVHMSGQSSSGQMVSLANQTNLSSSIKNPDTVTSHPWRDSSDRRRLCSKFWPKKVIPASSSGV